MTERIRRVDIMWRENGDWDDPEPIPFREDKEAVMKKIASHKNLKEGPAKMEEKRDEIPTKL